MRTEITSVVYETPRLTIGEKASRVGEVRARMAAAARGQMRGSESLVPVRTQPELWELRWQYDGNVAYRLYHAEPGRDPELVALLFHLKDVSDEDLIDKLQNADMQRAADRFAAGENRRWGHVRGCTNCLNP